MALGICLDSYLLFGRMRKGPTGYGEMFHWNDKSSRITSIDKANFVAAQDDFPFPNLSSLRNKEVSPTNLLPAQTLSPKRSKKTANQLPASPMEEVVVTLDDFPPGFIVDVTFLSSEMAQDTA
ncbi:hypothetical protein MVEN_00085100 [Mycena venus]|uniref:Uncharacterized protein n=1 Tax=Mycena venus TaxID=2733690 RepID=A0A8H6Z8H7_9AGAR|nr:hypothetical protein MVEN_00085100 [Mycena venus]